VHQVRLLSLLVYSGINSDSLRCPSASVLYSAHVDTLTRTRHNSETKNRNPSHTPTQPCVGRRRAELRVDDCGRRSLEREAPDLTQDQGHPSMSEHNGRYGCWYSRIIGAETDMRTQCRHNVDSKVVDVDDEK
jgi:hypothetical protein